MIRAAELRSGLLTRSQVETEVSNIIAVFQSEGWDRVIATRRSDGGREQDRPESEAEVTLPLVHLSDFVLRRQPKLAFWRGETDVTLRSVDDSFTFVVHLGNLLSRRHEVCLTSWDLRLAAEVEADWRTKHYHCQEVDRHTWYQLTPTGKFWME